MPQYTVDLLQDKLNEIKKSLKGANVGILGLSYKADVGDLRESPSIKIVELLAEKGANIFKYDPFLPEESNVRNAKELLKKSEAMYFCDQP